MVSNVEVMKKMFPKCPICGSEEGYEFSAFYPDVRCISCEAEWHLFKDGMELKRVSKMEIDKELLHKRLSFNFWKKWKGPQIVERIFSPMDYVGGHLDYKKPAVGYMLLKPDSLTYKTVEGCLHKMNVQISLEQLKGIELWTGKDVELLWFVLIGLYGTVLLNRFKRYLVVTYEDSSGLLQRMAFDFHNQRKMVDELITLVSYLKKKK